MVRKSKYWRKNLAASIGTGLLVLIFTIRGLAICTFQIAEGDDYSGMKQSIKSSFGLDVNEAKVDLVEKRDQCTFLVLDSKVRTEFKVSSTECQKIKLTFETNLVGLSCHSSLMRDSSAQ